MGEVFIRYVHNLPFSVKACTVIDSSDDFNIYINAALSSAERQVAYLHEMQHVQSNHFYDGGIMDIREIEAAARNIEEAACTKCNEEV